MNVQLATFDELLEARPYDVAREVLRLRAERIRLVAQLDSVRRELAATVANIGEWADVLADVIPALQEQMPSVCSGSRSFYNRETGRLECDTCPGDCPQAEPGINAAEYIRDLS